MLDEEGFSDNWLSNRRARSIDAPICGRERFVLESRALHRAGAGIVAARDAKGTHMMRELTMWRSNPDPHSSFLKHAPVHALQCVLFGSADSYDENSSRAADSSASVQEEMEVGLQFDETDSAEF